MDRFEGMSIVLAVAEAKALARALTSVRRPEPTDIVWEPTRLSCPPPRWAASRLPIAFGRPEPCRRSSGAFDPRRVLRIDAVGDALEMHLPSFKFVYQVHQTLRSSRSSFETTRVSASRKWDSAALSPGRSNCAPLIQIPSLGLQLSGSSRMNSES